MKSRSICMIATALSFVGCKPREVPPPTPNRVVTTPTQDRPIVPVDDVGIETAETQRWSYPSLAQRGVKLGMERSDNGLVLVAKGRRIELGSVPLSDCIDQLPQTEPPDHLPIANETGRPVWASLRGGNDEAAIMLSTRAATLLVDDGCVRSADITSALLGQAVAVDDPLFTADGFVPKDAVAGTGVVADDAEVVVDLEQVAMINGFDGNVTAESWRSDVGRWARVVRLHEEENAARDAVVGREYTAWLRLEPAVEVLVTADVRFGAEGPDREDSDIVLHWMSSALDIRAERKAQADALNVGAGRCPEMEGAVAFERVDETVTWALRGADGERVPLGKAVRLATYSSGCPKVANEELRKQSKLLADRAPTGDVSVDVAEQ